MTQVPRIGEWLSGKDILVTGATGYIGKVLIEKLLRSCPDVNRIYLILRSKRGKTVEERYQDVLKSDLWAYSKANYDFSKLVPIEADLSVAGMALSDANVKLLQDNVHIVFHGAASIKFTEPFHQAVKVNTRLTRDMVQLSKGMKNLELFVQISTAYVNSNQIEMGEKVYPAQMDWRAAIELAETADPMQLSAVTDAALGDFPNTYTLTKNMAEHVVWDHRHEIPILIYRPVIVVCLAREPMPGWTDNISGAEIIYYACGKGLVRILGFDKTAVFNNCPGDVTVNGILAASWKVSCHEKVTGIPAARVVNSNSTSFEAEFQFGLGRRLVVEQPIPDQIWLEYYYFIGNPRLFTILHLLFNLLPAFLVQTIAQLAGKKLPLTKSLQKFYVATTVLLTKFMGTVFYIPADNLTEVVAAMAPKDKEIYNCSLVNSERELIELYTKMMERFFLLCKERNLSLKERLAQRRRVVLTDRIARILLVAAFLYYFPYQLLLTLLVTY